MVKSQMSLGGQVVMIWWGLIFMYIYGFTFWGLLHMMPPPPASFTPAEVAAFYVTNGADIRVGAVICSWTAAFMVPIATVVSAQMSRLELGYPLWSNLQFAGGILMSIFLVLPPLFWGIAAFDPTRPADVTALMHQIATLTMTTTDQFFIFQMVAIAYIALTQKVDARSPFPRWLAYFTILAAIAFELGVFAFLFKRGPFSWNGLFIFWSPLVFFGSWVTIMCTWMLVGIRRQRLEAANHPVDGEVSMGVSAHR